MPAGSMPNYNSFGYSSYQGSMSNSPGMAQPSYTMPPMMGSIAGLPIGQMPAGSIAHPAGLVAGGGRGPHQAKAPGSTLTPQQIQQLLSLLPSANQ